MRAQEVAKLALGWLDVSHPLTQRYLELADQLQHADHYYNPNVASPTWRHDMVEVAVIGNHRFMRSKRAEILAYMGQ